MTPRLYRMPPPISEKEWQAQVVQLAGTFGWMVQHSRPSQVGDQGRWVTAITGNVGFPDLVLAHRTKGGSIRRAKDGDRPHGDGANRMARHTRRPCGMVPMATIRHCRRNAETSRAFDLIDLRQRGMIAPQSPATCRPRPKPPANANGGQLTRRTWDGRPCDYGRQTGVAAAGTRWQTQEARLGKT
jgi:hypothetical protein